jgi:hypothetical protein
VVFVPVDPVAIHTHPEFTNPVIHAFPVVQIACPVAPQFAPVVHVIVHTHPEFTNPVAHPVPELQTTCPLLPHATQFTPERLYPLEHEFTHIHH